MIISTMNDLPGYSIDEVLFVFVTRELAQAERLANRIVWLDGGRVAADPTPVPE